MSMMIICSLHVIRLPTRFTDSSRHGRCDRLPIPGIVCFERSLCYDHALRKGGNDVVALEKLSLHSTQGS